jgi:hypothetical protein
LSIDIVVKGPVLTGQASVVVTQLVDDIVDRVAFHGRRARTRVA